MQAMDLEDGALPENIGIIMRRVSNWVIPTMENLTGWNEKTANVSFPRKFQEKYRNLISICES